ncbi:MAG TPA: hypothetical protein VF041_08775 [Gemmatimonadaceae bacterium]
MTDGVALAATLMLAAFAIVAGTYWLARRAAKLAASRIRVAFWAIFLAYAGSVMFGDLWASEHVRDCHAWVTDLLMATEPTAERVAEADGRERACQGANDRLELRYEIAVAIVAVGAVGAGLRRGWRGSATPPITMEQPVSTSPAAGSSGERTYDISDLVRYWALSEWGTSGDLWHHCYLALCRAYEVPPDWEADQQRRSQVAQRWDASEYPPVPLESNSEYASHRRDFARLQCQAFWSLGVYNSGEVGERIHTLIGACYGAPREALRELDAAFFGGVYGADADRTFTEAELVARFGMPTTAAQQDAWLESL